MLMRFTMHESQRPGAKKQLISNFIILCIVCVFHACLAWSRSETLVLDNNLLYTRKYAMASYLSITGVEGIVQSKRFVEAAHRLALSWIRHVPERDRMQYDMVLLVTDPCSLLNAQAMALLRGVGWILVKVDPLYGIPSTPSYLFQNRYTHTAQFTKLRLWTFERYRHIIYLDSDMLVVKDLLHALSGYNVTANSLGVAGYVNSSDAFNAGFLYITPSIQEFEQMRRADLSMKYDAELQEQAFLNVYWKNRTVILPAEVNQGIDNFDDKCVVLHFIGQLKAWFVCQHGTRYEKACNEWDSYQSRYASPVPSVEQE
jgi:hypothetical protein